jgi:ABC-type nitrate/sulfonate/bicarbonate transport system permease component
MTLAAKPSNNKYAAALYRFLGPNGENVIYPLLGVLAVIFIWSLVSWYTTQNDYPSELPSPTQTFSDSLPYLQNFFSTRRGDEGIFILVLLSWGGSPLVFSSRRP